MSKSPRNSYLLLDASLALSVSLIWVASYGYTYNVSYYNSPPVNWLALVLWTEGLLVTLRLNRSLEALLRNPPVALLLTWVIYSLFFW